MTSRLLPIPLSQARQRIRSSASLRAPSLRAAVITFLAVLILFRWLHLILALQITSTGRQIQLRTEALRQCERSNAMLQKEIAEAESPRLLSESASDLGYAPRPPIYLPVEQPIVGGSGESGTASQSGQPAQEPVRNAAPASLGDAFGTWFEASPTQ